MTFCRRSKMFAYRLTVKHLRESSLRTGNNMEEKLQRLHVVHHPFLADGSASVSLKYVYNRCRSYGSEHMPVLCYSVRRASRGDMRLARKAGTRAATNADRPTVRTASAVMPTL